MLPEPTLPMTLPILSTWTWSNRLRAISAASGSVTSPIPSRMTFADGFAAANARTRRPISGKRYPAFSLR